MAAAPFVLAACGSSSPTAAHLATASGGSDGVATSTASPDRARPPAAANAVVSTATDSALGTVLVDADGKPLYTSNLDATGTIACVAQCATVWPPLTIASGAIPTGGSGVTGRLGTLTRPDGSTQVTYSGQPLYRFTADAARGQAKGNGVSDSFGGKEFSWSALTPTGPASTSSGGTGGGYGGGY